MFNFPMSPPAASNWAYEHDLLFYVLTILTVIFTVGVIAAVVYCAWKYRAGNKVDRSRPMYENLRIELTLTIVPLIMGLIFFYFSTVLYMRMKTMPKDGYEIFVIGKQWMWHVQHSNGVRENNTVHVPVGKPVKVTMISQDVLHAFYIPAFRVQFHVVPGRYTQLWFTPTKAGEYHLFCNMYCGTQHSEMGGKVIAMEPKEFANWLSNGGQSVAPMTMAQAGERVFNRVSCNNCHGAQNTLRAPTLSGILGSKRVMSNGQTVTADETYLRESILRPHNQLTAGYDRSMPVYEGQLTEEEVIQLLAYIREMGSAKAPTVSGNVNLRSATSESASETTNDSLSVGALQYNVGRAESTPTQRGKSPSVGAYAAEGKSR